MPANVYHFVTPWFIAGATLDDVWPLVSDASTFPAWWGAVFLGVEKQADGDPTTGIGARYRYHTRGYLPYHLYWTAEVTAIEPRQFIEITANGDFNGVGRWTLEQRGNAVTATLDWDIVADQSFIKRFAWLLNPLFAWNHQWAMRQGERGMIMHLGHRKLFGDTANGAQQA